MLTKELLSAFSNSDLFTDKVLEADNSWQVSNYQPTENGLKQLGSQPSSATLLCVCWLMMADEPAFVSSQQFLFVEMLYLKQPEEV